LVLLAPLPEIAWASSRTFMRRYPSAFGWIVPTGSQVCGRLPFLNWVSRMRPANQPGRRNPLFAGTWPFWNSKAMPMRVPGFSWQWSRRNAADFFTPSWLAAM